MHLLGPWVNRDVRPNSKRLALCPISEAELGAQLNHLIALFVCPRRFDVKYEYIGLAHRHLRVPEGHDIAGRARLRLVCTPKGSHTWPMLPVHVRAALLLSLAITPACSSKTKKARVEGEPITGAFTDDFERGDLGDSFFATTNNYQLVNGALSAKGAFNHPLWLTRRLPKNVSIEFDCWSNTADGDIKVEFFGDGLSHAATKEKVQYKATGYVAIMGGWNNSKSLLARRDEHGAEGVDLSSRTAPKVEVGKRYHWKITRVGAEIRWFVDDMNTPFLQFRDAKPLTGANQSYFAFNNWESDTWFDNLRITPL